MNNPREGLPSASSMHRVAACPGSVALEAQCPETETDDSKEGALGHAVLAGEPLWLDDKMQETVDACESITGQIVDAHGFAHIKPIVEQRHWWTEDGQKRFSGQFDRAYVDRENSRALVIDYKLLFGDHDAAAENWQLRTLALLVSNSFEVSHVIVALVQPWVKGQFTIAEYGVSDLTEAANDILRVVDGALEIGAPRIPGDHCKFCKGLAICPEAMAQTKSLVTLATIPAGVEVWTPQERGQMLDWIMQAEDVLEARKKALKEFELAHPGSIEGWHMKAGNSVRHVANISGLFWALKNIFGISMDEFLGACKVSIGDDSQLFKVFKAHSRLKGKGAEAGFDHISKEFITTKKNHPSLVKL